MKKLRYYLITFLAILFLPLFFSGNSFAVSDVTYTIDQDTPNNTDFCNSSCSTYKYIYIHDISLPSSGLYITLHLVEQFDNSNVLKFGFNSRILPTFLLYNVDLSSLSSNALVVEKTSYPGNVSWSFKVTLSENNPTESPSSTPSGSLSITENGTYDVTNYAEAVVNVPEPICEDCDTPFIVSLFKDSFWGIITACVSLIVPILALFLIFRLVHDWLWGKG